MNDAKEEKKQGEEKEYITELKEDKDEKEEKSLELSGIQWMFNEHVL